MDPDYIGSVCFGFLILICLQWLLFLTMKFARRHGYEAETIAFLLSTIGLAIVASKVPDSIYKQLAASVMGIFLFLFIGWALRDLERAKKIRYIAAAAGVAPVSYTHLDVYKRQQYPSAPGRRGWSR